MPRVTFKKAFGIEGLPPELMMWFTEIGTAVFTVSVDGRNCEIRHGQFGVSVREKQAIARFKHEDERHPDFIHVLPTVDIAIDVELQIPPGLDDSIIGAADELIEPMIAPAFRALQDFIEAYRDAKYLVGRGAPQWGQERGVFVRNISLDDFKTYLFYTLTEPSRFFVGVFSQGYGIMVTPEDERLQARVSQTLANGVPLERVLMLRAWEEYFRGDYRGAVVDSATVIEKTLDAIISHHLANQGAGSRRRINAFTGETSKRLLATVMLGLFGIGGEKWRETVAEVLDTRHALVHGQKRYATELEADTAIQCAERLLVISEALPDLSGASNSER